MLDWITGLPRGCVIGSDTRQSVRVMRRLKKLAEGREIAILGDLPESALKTIRRSGLIKLRQRDQQNYCSLLIIPDLSTSREMPVDLLEEARTALSPGGILAVVSPVSDGSMLAKGAMMKISGAHGVSARLYPSSEMVRKLITNCGWEIRQSSILNGTIRSIYLECVHK